MSDVIDAEVLPAVVAQGSDVPEFPEALLPEDDEPAVTGTGKSGKTFVKIGDGAANTASTAIDRLRTGTTQRRLTTREIFDIIEYVNEGRLTNVQIAARFEVHKSTITRVVEKYGDKRKEAKQYLHNKALHIVQKIEASANAAELIDVARSEGFINPATKGAGGSGNIINVGGNVDRIAVQINNGEWE